MCGGIEFLSFEGKPIKVYFPNPKAVLPVIADRDSASPLQFIRWGRRKEEVAPFPQGGWARRSSLRSGKWDSYRPKKILISVRGFMEKDQSGVSHWFDLDRENFVEGILVEKNGDQRAYVVTEDASATSDLQEAYIHPRWPSVVDGAGERAAAQRRETNSALKGRGSAERPPNRFEKLELRLEGEASAVRTEFFEDHARTIITKNDSPDVGFDTSVNPYRGCEHGCVYCYARPTHEYLGFSSGLDFESKILVKKDAPQLLRKDLESPRWVPKVIAMSGVTDCYQPVERDLRITRRCLEVLVDFRNPVAIVTKNHLVTRDVDLLSELARWNAAAVFVSVTTLDSDLASKLEPRASRPEFRLQAIEALAQAGIPVGVLVAPIIPGLNEQEIPEILKAAYDRGARRAGHVMVRLPYQVKDLFQAWLSRHFPEKKDRVLSHILEMRDGNMNQSSFGQRMKGQGPYVDQIHQLFTLTAQKVGMLASSPPLETCHFRKVPENQMTLF